ncbi:MAG TPA: ABC transporter permease [Terriglobales bacterium]|nr:ABC transporter permease [Terriglobales bacterium]
MKGALAVCWRDVQKFLSQPVLMLSTIVGPLLTLALLGSAFGGAIVHAPVAIVQESYGPYSSMFIEKLQNLQTCQLGGISCQNSFQLTNAPDLDTAQQMLRQGFVKAVVHIPLGFDDSLATHTRVIVTVTLDNTDPLSTAAIGPEVAQAGEQLSSLVQTSSSDNSTMTFDLEDAYRNVLYIEFMAPGTFVQAIMFVSIIAGGVQLVVDKERGIIEGYLVTPLKKYEIVVGVLLSGVFKALFASVALFMLAIVLTGIRPMNVFPTPDLAGIALTMVTLFLTSLGLIAMMTAYAVRSTSADLYRVTCFPINLTLYYTSGAIYPLDGMPKWMQQISVINPETYAVHALRLLMYKGASLQAVAADFVFLAAFTGLMLVLAIVAFRRAI